MECSKTFSNIQRLSPWWQYNNFDSRTITDDKELSKIFDEYNINVVQNTTGTAPVKISSKYESNNDKVVVEKIIKAYENHLSIKLIKDNVLSEDKDFTMEVMEPTTILKINKIINI